jgi:hypothetical protein
MVGVGGQRAFIEVDGGLVVCARVLEISVVAAAGQLGGGRAAYIA